MIQPGPGATGATGATGGKNSMSLGSPPALTPDQTSQIAQQAGPFTSQIAQQPTTPGVSSAATTGLPDWMKQGQQQWQQQQTQLQQLQQQIQQAQSALGQSGQSGQSGGGMTALTQGNLPPSAPFIGGYNQPMMVQ